MAAKESKGRSGAGGGRRSRLWAWVVRPLLLAVAVLYALGWVLSLAAPRAAGMNRRGQAVRAEFEFTFDLTGTAADGQPHVVQATHDALLRLVADADEFLILDQFLVNQYRGSGARVQRDTTAELLQAVLAKKRRSPQTWILFITDPVNRAYAPGCPPGFEPLVEAGVHVVVTDLDQLPDINRLYSPFHRALAPVLRRVPGLARPAFRNPFDAGAARVSALDVLALLNFKANHRKVAVAHGQNGRLHALVSSANPHTASSAHGNAGILLWDGPAPEIVASELQLARSVLLHAPSQLFSTTPPEALLREVEARLYNLPAIAAAPAGPRSAALRYCTEAAVADALEDMLARSGAGDRVDVLLFYLADGRVVRQLQAAAARGAQVRLLLDPNKDAFGRQKSGIPNRVVARRLRDWATARGADLQIRWFATRGEQGHFKTLRAWNPTSGRDEILIGSANFTPRNLRGYNLESAVVVENAGVAGAAWNARFERLWGNGGGVVYSVEFASYDVPGRARRAWLGVLTTFGNLTGFCTW